MRGEEEWDARLYRRVTWLSLFTSGSTLVCCALPALLVSVGAGAALLTLTSAVPQLIWLSEHKAAVFGIAALMLLAGGWLQWHARTLPCPVDQGLARQCMLQRRRSLRLYVVSVVIFLVGTFFAFVAPLLY
ncbi:MAG: hypothetical protein DIU74_004190 [Pseudomonadota bacterium]|nr:MAG: hypothetical protein DIU74_05930 [Pseudomonadota bacterium]